MRRGISYWEVTILILLSQITDVICEYGIPCPSGMCPLVEEKSGTKATSDISFALGKLQCGICGAKKIGGNQECHNVFKTYRTIIGSDRCYVRHDVCMEKKCKDDNTIRCDEVFYRNLCCICKENVFGTNCDLPPVINTYYGQIDVRDRPVCWVHFHDNELPWKSGPTLVSYVLVAWKEKINDLPFYIDIYGVSKQFYITKFMRKITKGESMNWCLTSTNIGAFCHEFILMFDPKYGEVPEVKHLVFIELEFPFYHSDKPSERSASLFYRNDKTIGALFSPYPMVYPFITRSPYFQLYNDPKLNTVGYSYPLRAFSNQTATDSTCVPWIKQLCSTSHDKFKVAFPYVSISFKMEYHRPPSECQTSSVQQWKIFKESLNLLYNPGDEIMTREGCCTLTFPPYTFAPGNYLIKLTIMHIQNENKMYNSKCCFHTIYNDKIKAHFDQLVRIVSADDYNKVEVEAKDINRPPKEQKKDLVYTWSCKFNGTDEPCKLFKTFTNSPSYELSPTELRVNRTYNFTVHISSTAHVKGIPNDTSTTVYQILIATETKLSLITLRCATCDESQLINPQESNVFLITAEDGKSPPTPADYEWQFAEETGGVVGEFRSVDDIREEHGVSNTVLKIKKNVLEPNKVYVFQAKVPNSKAQFAQIRVTTLALDPITASDLNCTLDPKEGVRGWTDFNIECILEEQSLLFEFYDKDEKDEHIFSGRMLGYNDFGILNNFKMTKGKFFVLVFDKNLAIKNYTQIIPLVPFNDTLKYLEELLGKAQEFTDSNQFDWPSATASSVADVTERKMNPPAETVKQPVLILHRVHFSHSLGLIKMVLSSLKIVLTNTASKFDILELDAHMTKTAANILLILSLELMVHEGNMAQERSLPHSVFFDMIKVVLDCAEILLVQRNREFRSKPEEYVIPFISDLVQQTSFALVSALDTASYSLNRQQIPGDNAKEIVSDMGKLLASTKVDFAGDLSIWSEISENCSVVISSKSISSVNLPQQLGLQYIRMRVNPFWWAGGNIVSEVLLVNLCQRTEIIDCRKLTRFKDFVTLRLNVIESLNYVVPIEGTAFQVDPKTTEEYKELELTVYRFFLPERAKFFIKFILNHTQEYRIMLTEGLRPEYASIVDHPNVINASSPDYNVPYDNKHENEKVYYMGILPSAKVSVGERMPFRFRAYYSLCSTWVKWQWTSFGCWVGAETSEESIHCDCEHLSVVAGAITTPDHNLSTITEFLLYLTPWENLLPLFTLILILLLYLLLLIWAVIKDRKDRRGGEVIVLDDNFPGERYAYLLGVHTGSRLYSGTSAAVGVRLIGNAENSRPHILRSPNRSVLNAFSEDWFLLYSPQYLGKLRRLWLWHNDEGISPDWFVERVEVYDLRKKVQYIFEINNWIAMDVDMYPDVFVSPVKATEYLSTMNTFRLNLVNGVRDTHNWTSVCLKHPRNPVSRVERVSVIVCFVLSVMAVSLLLYLSHFGFYIDEDKPSYYLATTDLLIFILALITANIVACLVMGLFRKSFTHKYKVFTTPHVIKMSQIPATDGQQPVWYRHSEEDVFTVLHQGNVDRRQATPGDQFLRFGIHEKPHQRRTICDNCVMALHKIAHGNSLLPVRLPGTKSDLIVRKPWFIAAWILCITIILLSVLIIIFYAWKLPTVKNEKFLTIFLGVVLVDALLISFVKILLFSVVLSYMFQNYIPGTTYHIKIKDGKRLHLFGDIPFLANLLQTRKQRVYYILRESVKDNKRQTKIRKYRWRIFIEFVIVVILLCIISAICKIYYIERYRSNTHATRMMTTGESTRIPNLRQVFNRTELYNFFEITYVSRLYRFMWYNYEPLMDRESGRKDWTSDCIMRLLGNTRIRQLRVYLDDCRVGGYFHDSIQFCARPWSWDTEDKDVYATSWLLAESQDTERKRTTWRYTEAESSNSSRFYGQSGTLYHGGGYIAGLGYSKRETRGSLLDLDLEGWLDHMTRAVFVELTLYNVNTDLFTQVVLVCEQHPTGQYVSMPKVESVTINIGFDFWNIGFITFQVFFLFRAIYFMERHGVFVYLSSILNTYEIFLLILGFATVLLYVVHVKYSSLYVEEYHRKGLDEFFSFYEIIRYDFMSEAVMCLLFVCVVVKLLLSWRFGRIYFSFFYAFLLSWSWMVWLALSLTICLIILWRFIGYQINVYIFSYYSIAIVHPQNFRITGVHERWIDHLIVYFMCILSSFVILLFIASFAYFYRVAKFFKPFTYKDVGKFNYVTFLKREIKILFGREKQPV